MVASNYSRAPFIEYLTLFQSRTAVINFVLPATSVAAQNREGLTRKLADAFKEKTIVDVDGPTGKNVLEYLLLKRFVGRKGKYPSISVRQESGIYRAFDSSEKQLSKVPIFRLDDWMADPRVRSVIGVPTPDNAEEILELCHTLGVLTSRSNSWTGVGQIAAKLRQHFLGAEPNPFVLGPEIIIIVRQLIERDGIMLAAMLTKLVGLDAAIILRDNIARQLPQITQEALKLAKNRGCPPEVMSAGKRFLRLTEATGKKREEQTKAPGVLEHRTTPRLEWLTDIGVLSKDGHAKNSFAYQLTDDANAFRDVVEAWVGKRSSPDDAALSYWWKSQACAGLRSVFAKRELRVALLTAYATLKRPIGPVAIRDICLLAGMAIHDRVWTMSELEAEVLTMARGDKRINLSGGRYKREPEFVHIGDDLLGEVTR